MENQLKDKDYKEEHENIRKSLWIQAWVGTANSANCVYKETPTKYADLALAEFDKRFKAPEL